MMCVVQKDFVGAGEDYVRNQLIDGAVFRNEQVLISQRYLRPATPGEIASAQLEGETPRPAPRKALKVRVAKRRE